jgi:curved DNA-binding protein CbpA
MDIQKDYYEILGVLPSIDDVALAAVYRALLKKYHPDVFGGPQTEAARRTRDIIEAYRVLGNPEIRQAYDSTRKTNGSASQAPPADEPEKTVPRANGQRRRYVVAAMVLSGVGVLTWATHSSQPTFEGSAGGSEWDQFPLADAAPAESQQAAKKSGQWWQNDPIVEGPADRDAIPVHEDDPVSWGAKPAPPHPYEVRSATLPRELGGRFLTDAEIGLTAQRTNPVDPSSAQLRRSRHRRPYSKDSYAGTRPPFARQWAPDW